MYSICICTNVGILSEQFSHIQYFVDFNCISLELILYMHSTNIYLMIFKIRMIGSTIYVQILSKNKVIILQNIFTMILFEVCTNLYKEQTNRTVI